MVGADHPVELPDPDGHLEARPGAGRRQRRRAQAGRADPGVDPCADGADRPTCCRPACSTSSTASASRRASRWRRRSRVAQGRVHRRDHHRPADHAVRQRRTSSRSRWSSAARARTSSSTTSRAANDDFYDKALEGFTMFALNQGEVCTCPSRALIQDGDLRRLPGRRASSGWRTIKQGNPLDTDTMIGAQASNDQLEKILSYLDIGQAGGRQGPHRRRARRAAAATWPAATTSSRRSSRATTRCGSSRRRSSARSSR